MTWRVSRSTAYCATGLLGLILYLYVSRAFHVDFVAFWCAGDVLRAHGNPYLDGALHRCETSSGLIGALTIPVPYPPYVMPIFVLASLMPQAIAFFCWSALLVVATLATARAFERLTGISFSLSLPTSVAAILIPNLQFGQLAPLPICCFAWALVFLRDSARPAAAAALTGMAIVPSFAVPAWLAALLYVRGLRFWLVAGGAVLATAACASMGLEQCAFYLTRVLPAHSLSELGAPEQLGLTAILRALGAGERQSIVLAYAGFTCAIVLGIAVGLRLRERYGGDHWIVAAAVAFGFIGAPFSHDHDVGFVLPFTLMLFSEMQEPLGAGALILLAAPWLYVFVSPNVADAAIVLPFLIAIVAAVTGRRLPATAVIVLAMAAFYLGIHNTDLPNRRMDAIAKISVMATPPPDALAEVRWKRFNDAVEDPPEIWLQRAPFYAGVLLLLLATGANLSKRDRDNRSRFAADK